MWLGWRRKTMASADEWRKRKIENMAKNGGLHGGGGNRKINWRPSKWRNGNIANENYHQPA
jgi:hypothetical protein